MYVQIFITIFIFLNVYVLYLINTVFTLLEKVNEKVVNAEDKVDTTIKSYAVIIDDIINNQELFNQRIDNLEKYTVKKEEMMKEDIKIYMKNLVKEFECLNDIVIKKLVEEASLPIKMSIIELYKHITDNYNDLNMKILLHKTESKKLEDYRVAKIAAFEGHMNSEMEEVLEATRFNTTEIFKLLKKVFT
jgi:hypothetical protein